MSTKVETPKRHPLLDKCGHERIVEFRDEYSPEIGGMDSVTVAVCVPSDGIDQASQTINERVLVGPRGLIEATLEFVDQWAKEQKTRLMSIPIPFASSNGEDALRSQPEADDEPLSRDELRAAIAQDEPNLPDRRKVQVAIFDYDDNDNNERIFGEYLYLTDAEVIALARDTGDVIRRYAATEAVPVASDSPDASEAELLTIIRELGPDYLAEKLRAAKWALHRHKQVARENRNTEKAASGELATVG